MSHSLRRTLIVGGALALLAPSAAMAANLTRSAGSTSATLTYTSDRAPYGGYVTTSTIKLTVRAPGRKAQTFTSRALKFPYPQNVLQLKTALQVRDISGDATPEVLLSSSTGGAHCCSETRVVRWDAKTKRYLVTRQQWGAALPRIQRLNRDRVPEFVGFDDSLSYDLNASYAASTFPPKVWNFRNGRFVDVTRSHPAEAVRGMNRAWANYLRQKKLEPAGRGNALAAYLISADLAGTARRRAAWKRVSTVEKANPALLKQIRQAVVRRGYRIG